MHEFSKLSRGLTPRTPLRDNARGVETFLQLTLKRLTRFTYTVHLTPKTLCKTDNFLAHPPRYGIGRVWGTSASRHP